jgi:hypothetical protein
MAGVKRFGRIAWNGLVTLSALLSVAMGAMWLHSYTQCVTVEWHKHDSAIDQGDIDQHFWIEMWDNWGTFNIRWVEILQPILPGERCPPRWTFDSAPPAEVRKPFEYIRDNGGGFVVVPIWCLMLPAMILPSVKVRSLIARRRRVMPGRCRVCSYDLRATPDRCPECGAVPDRK